MNKALKIIIVLIFFLVTNSFYAQEKLAPMGANINLIYSPAKSVNQFNPQYKVTALFDTLPFFEDFWYAPNSTVPSANHWTDSSVYISTGYGYAPPSMGVATFDGLNKKGYPYRLTAASSFSGPADTLTSKPISLYTQGTYTYSPTDSIALTFLYQRQGLGENPTSNDSLVLEFFKPLYPVTTNSVTVYGKWFRVWSSRGNDNPPPYDSTFKKAFIRISDTAYFHNGFKFRFRNKATGAGSPDNWNLDYISLKTNYFKTDTVYNEVAFGYLPRPILKNYSSMPWNQYTTNEMGTKFSCFIRNNNVGFVKNTNYEYSIINASGTTLSTYGGGASNSGNVNPFATRGWDSILTHRNPAVNFTLSPMSDSTHFYVRHIVNSTPDVWKYNDTIYQLLQFNNFYAYDDGSSEAAYYLNQPSSKTALRFTLNVTDTLRALDIYFVPFIDGNLVMNSTFRLYLWADGSGKPGTVIRRDSLMKPLYLKNGYNQFPRYFFTSPIILPPGTYYAGYIQSSNQPLYNGFDRNFNHMDALYYDIQGYWVQSQIPGSIMIHPVVGDAARAMVGFNTDWQKNELNTVKIYPNPAQDKIFISATGIQDNRCSIEIFTITGSKIHESYYADGMNEINTSSIANGLYFLVLKQNGQILSQHKFIIAR